jgi:hypothetical protein
MVITGIPGPQKGRQNGWEQFLSDQPYRKTCGNLPEPGLQVGSGYG